MNVHIQHLSPSHVNGFLFSPLEWCLRRVYGYSFPVGPKAEAGKAVETAAVGAVIHGRSSDDAAAQALEIYDEAAADLDADEYAQVRAFLPAVVREAVTAIGTLCVAHGKIVRTQRRIEHKFDGVSRPFLMFTDIEFEDGLIIDLKTVWPRRGAKSATPSMKEAWARQIAAYSKASNDAPVGILAVAPNKDGATSQVFMLDDVERPFSHLIATAQRIERLIQLDESILADAFAPDPEDWKLKDDAIFSAAVEVWPWLIGPEREF